MQQYTSAEDLIGQALDEAQALWMLEQLHEMIEGAQWRLSDRLIMLQLKHRFESQEKMARRYVDQLSAQHAKEMKKLGY